MTAAILLIATLAQPAPPTQAELERNLAEWMRRTPAEVETSRRMFEHGPKLRGER